MTKESENAAKWEIIEQYKNAHNKLVAIGHRCKEIGKAISTLGHAVAEYPEGVVITDGSVTYPKYAGSPAFERNKTETFALSKDGYDLSNIKVLVDEYTDTLQIKTEAEYKIRELGINPIGLLR